ncbi:MAG TPA: phosphoribosylamine--glycine ligase [Candidatus Limnocylindria bacterium]|nr:phosphoribosylamine--glycine ligase [Candidatus Limnocylindria bacterium]
MTGLPFGRGYKEQVQRLRAERPMGRSQGAPGLNAMVLGSGGREYAIAWALARADSVATIDAIPGNGGTHLFARTIDLDPHDIAALERHVAAAHIDLAVVGPDELIAAGLGDALRRSAIAVVGAGRDAAKIEWSKAFAKELMREAGVPTAEWTAYPDADAARDALPDGGVVVKADGLAAGKGVVVARTRAEAEEALVSPHIHGGAVVLEEVLEGEEASLHALVDGETVVALPTAKDHKRVGDGDTGPNTGGMGAVSPHPHLPDAEAQGLADLLIAPVARALAARGTPYRGVVFAGLIDAPGGWRVLEYNARFGDPEAQVLLPRIEGDVGRLFLALGEGRLAQHVADSPLRFSPRTYVDVALCAEGYPGAVKGGDLIEGLDAPPEGVYFFHAGTKRAGTRAVTAGGRVVHAVGQGETLAQARERAYAAAEQVRWPGRFYRSDIGVAEVES